MRERTERTRAARAAFMICAAGAGMALLWMGGPTIDPLAEVHATGQSVGPGPKPPLPPVAKPALNTFHLIDTPFGVYVSDSYDLNMTAGEVQSTVVPPGWKAQCPQGRLLISDDGSMQPASIAKLDLDNLGATPTFATLDVPPGWVEGNRRILSNDHDLIALPNGDVLLLKMGQSRMELNPEPDWFDHAYKVTKEKDGSLTFWGPGARSEIFVWRSENCGDDFTFVRAIDTAMLRDEYESDDRSGGLPQHKQGGGGFTDSPGSVEQPVWQMGGTDGPLARVDPATGRVYMTILLGGYEPASSSPFLLSNQTLNRTIVMMSADRGDNWNRVGVLRFEGWRLDVVPRQNDRLAFAHSGGVDEDNNTGIAFVDPAVPVGSIPDPKLVYASLVAPEPQGHHGWNTKPCLKPFLFKNKCTGSDDYMYVNLTDRTLLTRSPSNQNLLLAYMDTIDGGRGDGFRVYMYSPWYTWVPFEPIAPKSPHPDNFVLHVTPIDLGRGPVFLYWYDLDTETGRAAIRGRLVTSDREETIDFPVLRDGGFATSFDVTISSLFYGDYHTAGGYYLEERERADEAESHGPPDMRSWTTYHYYPVWIESDGKVHFAHVTYYEMPSVTSRAAAETLGYRRSDGDSRTIQRQEADPSRLVTEREEESETRRIR